MKKTLSVLLAGAMLAGTAPYAFADEYVAPTLRSVMDELSIAIPYQANVDVDANIEVRESGDTAYKDGPITINEKNTSDIPKFDYKATLYMDAVQEEFERYIDKAQAKIDQVYPATSENIASRDALATELDSLEVSGEFTVTIHIDDKMVIPESMKTSGSMVGFNEEAKNTFEEKSRVYDDSSNTMTITIKVKDGITKKKLEEEKAKYLGDLTLTCEGVEVNDFGTYEISGEIEGYTEINSESDMTELIPGAAETLELTEGPLAKIKYKAVQKDGTKEDKISETVVVKETTSSVRPSGTTGTTTSTISVITEVDGTQIDKKTSSSAITYNPYDLETPKKDHNLFGGWINKSTGDDITGVAEYTKTTTITAKWIPTGDVNVNFVIDGAPVEVNTKKPVSVTVPETAIVVGEEGTEITTTAFEAVVGTNKKFEGWFTDAECTIPAEESVIATEDITFYGKTVSSSYASTSENHYAYIAGYPDGTVKPEQDITREEVATIFFRVMDEAKRNENLKYTNDFTDVDDTRWSNTAISTMSNIGTVIGYPDGTFKPGQNITRAEFVAVVVRFAGLEAAEYEVSDISGHWAEEDIKTAAANGLVIGYEDGTFRPEQYITRAEVMAVVNRMLNRKVDETGLIEDRINWVDNTSDKWYYYDVLEATNSHKCEKRTENVLVEKWTERIDDFDANTIGK